MSDDDGDICDLIVCGITLSVIAFIFMTIASPGFVLYGFFSSEWLIDNRKSLSTATGNITIYYGLYRKCINDSCSEYVIDETAYGLEVTSVLFQFLAILALPWLKPFVQNNKYLEYWNYCFLPFLFTAAIFSLSASCYFLKEWNSKVSYLSTGKSQVCAGLGGGFQIVLACFITGFFAHQEILCFQAQSRPSTSVQSRNNHRQTTASTSFGKTENIFISVFSYRSVTTVNGNRVSTEQHQVEARIEQQQIERY